MDLSIFFAQLFGVYFLIVGVLLFARQKTIRQSMDSFQKKGSLLYVIGVLVLFLGLALVLSHNIWDGSWKVVVTIVAWLTLIKGLLYLFLPESLFSWTVRIMNNQYWYIGGGVLSIALGLYLTMKGFSV